MSDNGITTGDLALMRDGNNNNFTNEGMWFVLLLFMMAGGGFGYGNRAPMPQPNGVTQNELTNGLNNNAVQSQLQQIALSTANNNYETAQLINGQTTALLQQNSDNTINALQGFNNINMNLTNQGNLINQNIMNQTNQLGSKMDQLGYQIENCCCSIKTQMLEDRLENAQSVINSQAAQISNYNQSQYLLGQMGRFVAWNPSGSADAAKTTTVAG